MDDAVVIDDSRFGNECECPLLVDCFGNITGAGEKYAERMELPARGDVLFAVANVPSQ